MATSAAASEATTPVLRFSVSSFRGQFSAYALLGDVFYPVKVNDHVAVLEAVRDVGGSFEVNGLDHVKLLLRLGVPPGRILFGLPVAPARALEAACQLGVAFFVVDSVESYHLIVDRLPSAQFLVRLTLSDVLRPLPRDYDKWGMPTDAALDLARRMAGDGCAFAGPSFYLPKPLYSHEALEAMLRHIATTFRDIPLASVNVGGGLEDPNDPRLASLLRRFQQDSGTRRLIVEPGRCLLNPAIDMIVTVIGIRRRRAMRWAYLDAGIYSGLLDAALLKRRFAISALRPGEPPPPAVGHDYWLSGPTSDTLDVLGRYEFPAELREGDQLIVRECGAYTYVLQTGFGGASPLTLEVIP